jgi:hypothetical protein
MSLPSRHPARFALMSAPAEADKLLMYLTIRLQRACRQRRL